MRAIIFGINSQDGYYLSLYCQQQNIEVIGVSRSPGDWLVCSVANREYVQDIIKSNKPDYIFHLAAVSSTKYSVLFENNDTIVNGTLFILDAVKEYCPSAKVFITGSGLQFINKGVAIKETDDFFYGSAYAMSRTQSVCAARYYRQLGLQVYVGYLFHHESPRRKISHVSKKVAETAKRVARGSNESIVIGDLSVKKEWGYAKDISEGIFHLCNQECVFESCIGTGKYYSIGQWVEACFALAGKDWRNHVEASPPDFIPEYPVLYSDPTTMKNLGWEHKTSFENLVAIMMNN